MPRGILVRSAWEATSISDPDGKLSLDAYEAVAASRTGRHSSRPSTTVTAAGFSKRRLPISTRAGSSPSRRPARDAPDGHDRARPLRGEVDRRDRSWRRPVAITTRRAPTPSPSSVVRVKDSPCAPGRGARPTAAALSASAHASCLNFGVCEKIGARPPEVKRPGRTRARPGGPRGWRSRATRSPRERGVAHVHGSCGRVDQPAACPLACAPRCPIPAHRI
jgi:hypothetical protein